MPTALDTIAHTILPNLMKLKGAATLVSAIERRDISIFSHVWESTGIAHAPQYIAKERSDVWRIGVLSMPAPEQMGDAHMVAFVAKKNDAAITRYFTLEHDYVLATQAVRTVVCEQEGTRMLKRVEGPATTGDFAGDADAFIAMIGAILTGGQASSQG